MCLAKYEARMFDLTVIDTELKGVEKLLLMLTSGKVVTENGVDVTARVVASLRVELEYLNAALIKLRGKPN
jgi:hypothetical protein